MAKGSTNPPVGIVSPGAMGAALAAAIIEGTTVMWAGEGRGAATRQRAEAAGLTDAGDLPALADACGVIISVCPPESAVEVADRVAACSFAGTYLEANALAPATTRAIRDVLGSQVAFVDGGIVGPPPRREGTSRLYLAGGPVEEVAGLFGAGPLETVVLDAEVGGASALKACYAAFTKAGGALLLAIRALAHSEGVESALVEEWARSQPFARERSETWAASSAPKAWRFVGEMHEIGDALADAGLPDGFLRAAAETYARLADHKDAPGEVALSTVVADLLGTSARRGPE